MFCPNCGHELPGGAAFCAYCGQRLPEELVQNGDQAEETAIPSVADQREEACNLWHTWLDMKNIVYALYTARCRIPNDGPVNYLGVFETAEDILCSDEDQSLTWGDIVSIGGLYSAYPDQLSNEGFEDWQRMKILLLGQRDIKDLSFWELFIVFFAMAREEERIHFTYEVLQENGRSFMKKTPIYANKERYLAENESMRVRIKQEKEDIVEYIEDMDDEEMEAMVESGLVDDSIEEMRRLSSLVNILPIPKQKTKNLRTYLEKRLNEAEKEERTEET